MPAEKVKAYRACRECSRLRRKCTWKAAEELAAQGPSDKTGGCKAPPIKPQQGASCDRCLEHNKICMLRIKRTAKGAIQAKPGLPTESTTGDPGVSSKKAKSSRSSGSSEMGSSPSPVIGAPAGDSLGGGGGGGFSPPASGMGLDELYNGIFSNCGDTGTLEDLKVHEQSAMFWAAGMVEHGVTTCPPVFCCYIWGMLLAAVKQKSVGRVAAASMLAVRCGVIVSVAVL